jgi:isopenicillin-N N-acyltransferase-like protein
LLKKIVSRTLLTLLLITIVTLPCDIQPVKAQSRNIIATYGSGYLEDVDGLLVLHVKGSPYEMGYQMGFLLKDSIQAHIQYQIQEIIDMGYSYEYLVYCAQAMEPHIPQEYIEEMQGLADGASMNYTYVLLEQAAVDIFFYGPGWTGCSGFVVFENATRDGHLYHGRSVDGVVSLPPEWMIDLITVYEPENGNAFVNVHWNRSVGPIGVFTGMNKEGITVGMKASWSSDKTLDGMPLFFMLREVLQYSNNLTQAINIINQTDRTIGQNIVLGDGKNLNACVVEISAHYCKVFWAGDPAEDIEPHYSIPNSVRRTNHYVDPELAATQRSSYDPRETSWIADSWARYEKLSELIEDNYGNIDADMSIEFLRTPPVAHYPDNHQSVVFDSTNLELWVAYANSTTPAYEREFIYLSYDDLFSEYLVDLTISSTAGGNVTAPGESTFIYEKGTEVNLVAEPDEGYRFVNWIGDVDTIADVEATETTITMEGNYEITASFEEEPSGGWCFIATAAYGTPMAEEIQILRVFRDEYLLTNPLGQSLVGLYYKVSPPIAEFITEHPSLKPMVRAGLLPAVAVCTVVVNTNPAEKMVIVGLLALVSVALAVWATRRRGGEAEVQSTP